MRLETILNRLPSNLILGTQQVGTCPEGMG
jgi:hypothetical protein